MNRRREPTSIRAEKKIQKEIHKTMTTMAATPRTKEELEAIAKMHPRKVVKMVKVIQGVSKNVARKQVYSHNKLSKRTDPQQKITNKSSPAHVHTENATWAKTVNKQSVLKGKRLSRKLSHQNKRASA